MNPLHFDYEIDILQTKAEQDIYAAQCVKRMIDTLHYIRRTSAAQRDHCSNQNLENYCHSKRTK